MATRFYLKNTTPTVSPTAGEKSSSMPGSDTPNHVSFPERVMNDTAGSSAQTVSQTTLAQTGGQEGILCRFSTPRLAGQTLSLAGSPTFTLAYAASETNAAANAQLGISIYGWDVDSQGTIAYGIDAAYQGTEWATSLTGKSITFLQQNPIVIPSGSILVLEVWYTAAQSMGVAYSVSFAFNGATAVVDGTANSTPASYLEYSGTITTLPPAKSLITYQRTARNSLLRR